IVNKGIAPASTADYTWMLEGVPQATGAIPVLQPGEQTTVDWQWTWVHDALHVGFQLDNITSDEVTSLNDSLETGILDLQAAFWVEETVYDYFNKRESVLGSFSWEDWARDEMVGFVNQSFADAVFPLTPTGIGERMKIEFEEVVQDGIIYNGALPPFRTDEEPHYDNVWGWPKNLVEPPNNPEEQAFIGGVTHELGHQIGLPDLYALNVVGDDVLVKNFAGELVAGTDELPLLPYNVAYLTDRLNNMMGGNYTRWSDWCSYMLDFKKQLRRPDLVAPHLGDFADDNCLQLFSTEGTPLAGAIVWVFQVEEVFWDWYRKVVDNDPEIVAFTDEDGIISLGDEPFGDYSDNRFAEGMILLRIRYNSQVEYRFQDQIEFNLAYWGGQHDTLVLPLQTTIMDSAIPGMQNLALGKPATASSELYRHYPSNAVNGDKLTIGDNWAPQDPDANEWWQVDLTAPYDVSTIKIYPAAENWYFWFDRFRIDVSLTGAFAGEEITVVTEDDWPDTMLALYRFEPITARYIRVTGEVDQPQGYGACLQEFEVYGTYVPTGDLDGDGLPDDWEYMYFGGLSLDPTGDGDNDGLSNAEEWQAGSDPTLFDTDFDGWSDSWEYNVGFDPTVNDRIADDDNDGTSNWDEYYAGTDPWDPASFPILFDTITYVGETAGDRAGSSVLLLTGFDDSGLTYVVTGAAAADRSGSDAGAVYLVVHDPQAEGVRGLDTAAAIITGESAGDGLGWSAAAGDLDGDGYEDLAIAAPFGGSGGTGCIYLFYGDSVGLSGIVPAQYADARLLGAEPDALTGLSLVTPGDVNGDGLHDLAAGAPGYGADDRGRCYLLLGQTSRLAGDLALDAVALVFTSDQPGDMSGMSCAGGDMNGDGYDDFSFSANCAGCGETDCGAVHLFFGEPSPGGSQLAAADLIITGASAGDNAGAALVMDQDLDQDGFADCAVGAPGVDDPDSQAGTVYIVYGAAVIPSSLILDAAVPSLAGQAADGIGQVLSGAGRMLAFPGKALFIGNPWAGIEEGLFYLDHHGASRITPGEDSAGRAFYSETGWDYFDQLGFAATGGVDITDDGYAELVVSALEDHAGGSGAGRVMVMRSRQLEAPSPISALTLYADDSYQVPVSTPLTLQSPLFVEVVAENQYNRLNGVVVEVTSDSDPIGIHLLLPETAEGANLFHGRALLGFSATSRAADRLRCAPGDQITVTCTADPAFQASVTVGTFQWQPLREIDSLRDARTN
ncbi:FG-GAP repeat protein, partial [bacterium]|nr:FG-GAP repeat protein [candidate division CSSED10-310 bacterium]